MSRKEYNIKAVNELPGYKRYSGYILGFDVETTGYYSDVKWPDEVPSYSELMKRELFHHLETAKLFEFKHPDHACGIKVQLLGGRLTFRVTVEYYGESIPTEGLNWQAIVDDLHQQVTDRIIGHLADHFHVVRYYRIHQAVLDAIEPTPKAGGTVQ